MPTVGTICVPSSSEDFQSWGHWSQPERHLSQCEAWRLTRRTPSEIYNFNGQPSGYRDFRRKVILSVAGLEDKHAYLAGPRLLSRLSGEAWRATEHLSVGSLRQSDGWLKVIRALDDHYKYLPETELHDAIEKFLFMLKRRPNEGATSFSSRFRTKLDRVQTLIAQERDATRKKRKRKHGKVIKTSVT